MVTKPIKAGLSEADGNIALAAAVQQGQNLAGVNALPAADKVPVAFSSGEVQKSSVPEVMGTAAVEIAQKQATLEQLKASPDVAKFLDPSAVETDAKQLEQAFSKQKGVAPPVNIGMGGQTISAPASIRTAANNLHTSNPFGAKDFWKFFIPVKSKRSEMAMLAAKAGPAFKSQPFAWWSQQIFPIFTIDGFEPVKRDIDGIFDENNDGKQSQTYSALVECFGVDNAFLIYQKAMSVKISLKSVVDQTVDYLIDKANKTLVGTQSLQSMDEWSE